MYKLTVVGGPQRGSTYSVGDGNVSIGRMSGNDIVLQSTRVSKRHCVLVVDNAGITVKDAGSSNGTFVNGVLAKSKRLSPGDRISVGEYILELTSHEGGMRAPEPFPGLSTVGNVLPFPDPLVGAPVAVGSPSIQPGILGSATGPAGEAPGKEERKRASLLEKLKFNFERYIINFLYNFNERHEWKNMVAGLFAASIAFSIFITVYIVTSRTDLKLRSEARYRASLLARQIVDRNASAVLERMETKTDVGFAEKEPGVSASYLIDMEGRILAPGRKLNQYITEDKFHAAFAASARKAFQDAERSKAYYDLSGDIVAVAEPVRVLNPSLGKNVSAALGLVFFDQRLVTFDSGTEYMMFINAAILASIFALAAFVSIYRVTLRPIQQVNEEVDLALKGAGGVVTKKFRMSEMNPLIDVINAALQRVSGSGPRTLASAGDAISPESAADCLKAVGEKAQGLGMMVFSQDKRILSINPFLEEATGIRADSAVGAELQAASRDEAFSVFVQDLLERAQAGAAGAVSDHFEISGSVYKMECFGLGSEGNPARAFVLLAEREG